MRWAARQRRSPTISWNPPAGACLTTMGWMSPADLMDSASDRSASSSNCCRGWPGFGRIWSVAIMRIASGSGIPGAGRSDEPDARCAASGGLGSVGWSIGTGDEMRL